MKGFRIMREVPHPGDKALAVMASTESEVHNASNAYAVTWRGADNRCEGIVIEFQREGIDSGGLTEDVLIAILIDRLAGLQNGPLACTENSASLRLLEAARVIRKKP